MDDKNLKGHLISLLWGGALAALLIYADQATKVWSENVLKDSEPIPLIEGVLELQYLENTGAAFGMFRDAQTFFFISTVAVMIIIVSVLARMPVTKRLFPLRFLLYIIFAGAIGNFIDRIRFRYVRDFIYFKLINFPIFNVADICVTCATILLIILMLAFYKDKDLAFLSRSGNQ